MRSKVFYISTQVNGEQVAVLNEEKTNKRLSESLLQLEKEDFNEAVVDEEWVEIEVAKREKPHIEKMIRAIEETIQNHEEFLLTYPSDLFRQISEEVVRLSRDEPGGIKACRVHLNLVPKNCCADSELEEFLTSKKEIPLTRLGSPSIAETRVIETSVIDVYLFSSCSFLSRLQGIMTSLTKRNKNSFFSRASLLPEFVLVKRKLFRSRNSDPSVLVKSVPS